MLHWFHVQRLTIFSKIIISKQKLGNTLSSYAPNSKHHNWRTKNKDCDKFYFKHKWSNGHPLIYKIGTYSTFYQISYWFPHKLFRLLKIHRYPEIIFFHLHFLSNPLSLFYMIICHDFMVFILDR